MILVSSGKALVPGEAGTQRKDRVQKPDDK